LAARIQRLIVTCEKCLHRYSVAEELVRGRSLKLRCKNCQDVINVVSRPEAAVGSARSAPAAQRSGHVAVASWDVGAAVTSPARGVELWFAMVKGRQSGPLAAEGLLDKVKAGDIVPRTYLWREGMKDWKRAADLPELGFLFAPGKLGSDGRTAAAEQENRPVRSEVFLDGSEEVVKARPLPALKLSPDLVGAGKADKSPQGAGDLFQAFSTGDSSDLTPGEETRFVIAQAGVKKRNPPWKIAAFVAALITLPATVLYLLSELKVGPLVVSRIDASGREVKESVFSAEGVSGLGELLLGGRQSRQVASAPKSSRPIPIKEPPKDPRLSAPKATSSELKSFYADSSHVDVGPKLRRADGRNNEPSGGGLAQEEVAKVVAQTQPAFQSCIDQEMRKNPRFKGGKILVNAIVGSSGIVKAIKIDRPEIDSSSLGECLKSRARRMVFSSFSGEDTEVQIPLILTTAL
jgi:predicted Zn finger-like uncharacterized protein